MKKTLMKKISVFLPIIAMSMSYLSMPDEIILTKHSNYEGYQRGLVSIVSTTGQTIDTDELGTKKAQARLFNTLPIKNVNVSVVPQKEVIVSGEPIGIRIYSDGIMVVKIESMSKASSAGIKKGDIIKSINNEKVTSTKMVTDMVSKGNKMNLEILRKDDVINIEVTPQKQQNKYVLGMWIRDSGAGIGTLSFQDPETLSFGSLGHAICDSDTKNPIPLRKGSVSSCTILSVKKGRVNTPGELSGDISSIAEGRVFLNNQNGIYGVLNEQVEGIKMPVATRFQIKEGLAKICCDVDGDGVKFYDIEITSVKMSKSQGNKNMQLRVIDETLLSKTGGIVQGMSGSPILQNGKLVGAVTHVFVNDPSRGYGIFIENMLSEAEKIK